MLPRRRNEHTRYQFGIATGPENPLTIRINGEPTDCIVSIFYEYLASGLSGSMQLSDLCRLDQVYALMHNGQKANEIEFCYINDQGVQIVQIFKGVKLIGEERRAMLADPDVAVRILFEARELVPKQVGVACGKSL